MKTKFYKWLMRFTYRQLCKTLKEDNLPDGIPGIRDETAQCSGYAPRKRQPGEFAVCSGDGHYLCKECCLLTQK